MNGHLIVENYTITPSNKYGNDLNQIKYYETTEVKDSSGRLYTSKR